MIWSLECSFSRQLSPYSLAMAQSYSSLPANNSFFYPQGLSGDPIISAPVNRVIIWSTGATQRFEKWSVTLGLASSYRGVQYVQIAVSQNNELPGPNVKPYGSYEQRGSPFSSTVHFRISQNIYSTSPAVTISTVHLNNPITLQQVIMSMHNSIPGYSFKPSPSTMSPNYDWVYLLVVCLERGHLLPIGTLDRLTIEVHGLKAYNRPNWNHITWPPYLGHVIKDMTASHW
ncbi:hypothetical protein BJ912DRAFT_949704 [Pholiota molesta]|nr:hypothetical protein BJ912DRAFT_949704 [Pholiota molesta]